MRYFAMTRWIDITDLMAWRGSFTGIQRVIHEYSVRLEADGAKFFAYDEVDCRFIEVTLRDVEEQSRDTANRAAGRASRRHQIRLVLGAPYYRLSDKSKVRLRPYVRVANHIARAILHRAVAIPKSFLFHPQAISVNRAFPDAVFKKDDLVVLLGAGWNTPIILQRIIQAKRSTGIRLCQHINDILPIYQPQLFAEDLSVKFAEYMADAIKNADIITVISQATKSDIEAYCIENKIKQPEIRVVRLGDNPVSTTTPAKPQTLDAAEFILAVGTFEVRKNYQLIYQAVKLAQIEQREIPLIVIAGRPGWLSGDLRHLINHDPYAKTRIIWLDKVSDTELSWLYDNCMFTIFPSIAEGWGLPIAESLQHGKFCLSSGLSSMLEIGDGLVDYFLPYDPRECMEKIHYYVAEKRYKEANMKVASEYRIFTWDESYAQLQSALGN